MNIDPTDPTEPAPLDPFAPLGSSVPLGTPGLAAYHRHRQPLTAEMFEQSLEGRVANLPKFLQPLEVADLLGWSRRTIYQLCEPDYATKQPPPLESHILPGRGVKRKLITRRSVAALILRSAEYDPRDFPAILRLTLPTMPLDQLHQFAQALKAEIQKKSKS